MSSAGHPGKVASQNTDDVAGYSEYENRNSQWGTISGKVVSFDKDAQTATVQPLYRPTHDGQKVDMPELLEVPVRFPRAGGGAFTHPVKPGDNVELRPAMRDSEKYHAEGTYEAEDTNSFSLSSMEAYVTGGESLKNPIKNFDGENHHVRFNEEGTYGIRGSEDGKIAIEGSEGNIYTLLADAVKLAGEGFTLLGTEPGLVHASEYAQKGEALLEIESKLRGMAL